MKEAASDKVSGSERDKRERASSDNCRCCTVRTLSNDETVEPAVTAATTKPVAATATLKMMM